MTNDHDLPQLCKDIFDLAEGAPEDEESFVAPLGRVVERYDTPAEEESDFVVSQLVYSLLHLVMRHGTEEERKLAEECYFRFTDALLGYCTEEAAE